MKTLIVLALYLMPIYSIAQKFSFETNVTIPPIIADFSYEKVAVGDITNSSGWVDEIAQDVTDNITNTLFDLKMFEVLDRQNLKRILAEHNLNENALIDERSAKQIGMFIGTGVLVFGRVQKYEYKEEVLYKTLFIKANDCDRKYYRKGTLNFTINITLVDVETSEIVASKSIDASMYDTSPYAMCVTPEPVDTDNLYKKCLQRFSFLFKNIFSSYDKRVTIKLEKAGIFKKELEAAVTMIKVNEFDDAIKILTNITHMNLKNKDKAKAYYNLGTAYYYQGKYNHAKDSFKNAVIHNSTESDYNSMYQAARDLSE